MQINITKVINIRGNTIEEKIKIMDEKIEEKGMENLKGGQKNSRK